MDAALLTDALCREHEPGQGHPERPERYDAVLAALRDSGLMKRMTSLPPRSAEEDELALVHHRRYLQLAKKEILAGLSTLSTGDTDVSPGTYEAALHAAGGVLNAVDAVCGKKTHKVAFCAVRPPGHHASPGRGMGFCVYNNIAVAARYAQKKHGLERVLIVDWDVHHGNGTQDVFYEDGSVFFFSTHQSPWYPGTGHPQETGEGAGRNTTLNCPFPAGSGHQEIMGALRGKLQRAADDFRPDLVLVSAGFDSRLGDPLGQFTLTDQDFRQMTLLLREIAGKHCGGRLISVLEGGYSLQGLAAGVTAHVGALLA